MNMVETSAPPTGMDPGGPGTAQGGREEAASGAGAGQAARPALPRPAAALVLTHDVATPAAKTAEAIARALRRAGVRTFCRDTADVRWLASALEERGLAERRRGWADLTSAKFRIYHEFGGADTILGLDLNWILDADPFLAWPSVRQVLSVWFDDLRTACVRTPGLPGGPAGFQEVLRHAKVHHAWYGDAPLAEARRLGLTQSFRSALAADADFLAASHPVRHPRRLAFIGGPGGATPPSALARELMEHRADLDALRAAAVVENLDDPSVRAWCAREPTVRPWLEEAMSAKRACPTAAALDLLLGLAPRHPRAFAFLEEESAILDAALFVKLTLRYDRPALVHRLYRRGLVDVFSAAGFWSSFGVEARPVVPFRELAATYQAYPAHLNAGYSAREAPANEKLFETAACARASFNLAHPDLEAAFAPGEVLQVRSLAELEDQVRYHLHRPRVLAEIGEQARLRVAAEHTWDHRVGAWFDLGPPTPSSPSPFRRSTAARAPERPTLLVVSHDLSYAFAKTTESLARAAENIGYRALVRDSCDARNAWGCLEAVGDAALTRAAHHELVERHRVLLDDFGIDEVVSLDLGWLYHPDLFLDRPSLRRIVSIWFDDFHSWCRATTNRIHPGERRTFQEAIRDPRVRHAFYGEAMVREAALLGYANTVRSRLAAPSAYLAANHPCTITDRLAFIGNPGYRLAPTPEGLALLQADAELPALRARARDELIAFLRFSELTWVADDRPATLRLIGAALEARLQHPHLAALDVLELCRPAEPARWDELNRRGLILDVATFIKLVNRYDRPAIVHRLYRRGLCDVFSNQAEWEPWGVKAGPSVFSDGLPAAYQRYVAHVNAANPLRDAPANEKLFEIAACGRVSINLWSPDLVPCYDEGEVVYVHSLEEAEAAARRLLADPSGTLSAGKRARLRTAREHTWEHRLSALLAR